VNKGMAVKNKPGQGFFEKPSDRHPRSI